jgi:hypothetical protein
MNIKPVIACSAVIAALASAQGVLGSEQTGGPHHVGRGNQCTRARGIGRGRPADQGDERLPAI